MKRLDPELDAEDAFRLMGNQSTVAPGAVRSGDATPLEEEEEESGEEEGSSVEEEEDAEEEDGLEYADAEGEPPSYSGMHQGMEMGANGYPVCGFPLILG